MARILYAVMGNTHGHIMRSLAIASPLYPKHQFYFVGGGRVPENLHGRFPCLEVPVLRTAAHRAGRVSVPLAGWNIARGLAAIPFVTRRIRDLIERWQPDVAFVDREFYLPFACQSTGLPVVSIDHSHLLVACQYRVPDDQRLSWRLAYESDRLLFDRVPRSLVVSFYHPPLRAGRTDEMLPAVLRPSVREMTPREGDHILCYQTSDSSRALVEALRSQTRPVIAYGAGNTKEERDGNVTYRIFDDRRILEDLAGCAFAVINGGHNLLCEALHFGKPVFCVPVPMLFEQWLNAWHVRELGLGDYTTDPAPSALLLRDFEARLDLYRANAVARHVDGTDEVVARVRRLIESEFSRPDPEP